MNFSSVSCDQVFLILIININVKLNVKFNTQDDVTSVCIFFSSDGACDVYFPGYNKTCMPTIRQIVDCLVTTHPIRACGPRLLLSAINSNRVTNEFNQDINMVASNNNSNNNESVESYQNTQNPYHDHSYI